MRETQEDKYCAFMMASPWVALMLIKGPASKQRDYCVNDTFSEKL